MRKKRMQKWMLISIFLCLIFAMQSVRASELGGASTEGQKDIIVEETEDDEDSGNNENLEGNEKPGEVTEKDDTDITETDDEQSKEIEIKKTEDTSKYAGWIRKPEGWYFYESGKKVNGWRFIGAAWYYLDANDVQYPGRMLSGSEKKIDGQTYCFDKSGAMRTGWVKRSSSWYYYENSGAKIMKGWKWIGSSWYYFETVATDPKIQGRMAANGEKEIGRQIYYFHSGGQMARGWIQKKTGWFYYDSSGVKAKEGWKTIGRSRYYFENATENPQNPGRMFNGKSKSINGITYYFLSSGALKTGWLNSNGGWYYLKTNGQKASGWICVSHRWYYLDAANGRKMVSSTWKTISGARYYFNSDGSMATGWRSLGSKWYYLGSDGSMKTGWHFVENYWYYMYKNNDKNGGTYGVMASNRTIEGYYLDASGRMIPPDMAVMNSKAQGYSSPTPYLLLVNRNTHKVGIYLGNRNNWRNVSYWDCGDGAPSTPTISGVFSVGIKGYYFDSGAARCYWYTQFRGNYLFHSVLYNKNGTLMDGRLGMGLSHGCVRLKIENAKWIYDNIPMGSTVVVY